MRWDVGMNEARAELSTWSLSVIMNSDGAECLKGNFPDFQPGLYHHNVGPNELFGGHLTINKWGALGEFNTDNFYNNYPLPVHYPTYYMATYKKNTNLTVVILLIQICLLLLLPKVVHPILRLELYS